MDPESPDRPGITVTLVLCPYCDQKFPTEQTVSVSCIQCQHTFGVAINKWEDNKSRIPNRQVPSAPKTKKEPKHTFWWKENDR